MRTIRFRAWDTRQKKMWSADEMGQDQLTISPDGRGFINVSGEDTSLSKYYNHLVPLQSTGLADKNGKEIFEGDILGGSWGVYVAYCDKCKSFEVFDPLHECMACDCDVPWCEVVYADDLEVIGNIHQNPELLEGD